MTMPVKELKEWLNTLPKDAKVGVDEGGLCLRVVGEEDKKGQSYCEVGGLPEGDDR